MLFFHAFFAIHSLRDFMPIKTSRTFLGLFALSLMTVATPVYAYLDPGTGSMLLSVFVGLASSAYFFIRRLPAMLRSFLFRVRGGRAQRGASIVFYAESAAYWNTFAPILQELAKKDVRVSYLTSDKNDPVFKEKWANIRARYIGEGNTAYTSLGFVEADRMVLTTPGVDVLQIRRSPGVKKYIHVVHASADIHSYKLFSFDYYDAIYCSGPHQVHSIRTLEKVRGTTPKELPLLGCPYFDGLLEKKANSAILREEKTILVAPTWGRNGLLTRTGSLVPKLLARAGYHVILRPHPQSWISDKRVMVQVQKDCEGDRRIEWDRDPNNFRSLSRASLLISDFSGVIFDYAFLFERPVVTLGGTPKKECFEAWDLPHNAWELRILKEIGVRLADGKEGDLVSVVEDLLGRADQYQRIIRSIREQYVVNFGRSGALIAQALVDRLTKGKEKC